MGAGSLKILTGVLVHRVTRPLRGSVSCGSGGARPTSLGGGRARLSAAAGDLRWGRESPPDLPFSGSSGFGARLRLRHACGVSSRAALAPLAFASGSERCAWSATEWGGLPGGRARSAPALGESGPRGSEGGGAAAAHWLPTRPHGGARSAV